MNLQQINLSQLVSQIAALITQLVGYGLLILIAGAVLHRFGWHPPYVPNVDHVALAYLAGAWWLYRK